MRLACQLPATFFLCLAIGTQAGQQPQTPVFTTRTDLVRVSVEVVDTKTRKPVIGLTERDFTISENKAPQAIASFASETRTAQDGAVSPNRRIFLIVLGWGVDGPMRPFDGLRSFLRQRALPNDLVAVMAFNRATPFTTDHAQITEVIGQLELRREKLTFEINEHSRNTMAREDVPESLQATIDAAFQPPGHPGLNVRNLTTALLGTGDFRKNDRAWRAWNRMVMYRDLLKVYAGIEHLRSLEGEKHLVCLTPHGFGGMPLRLINGPIGLQLDSREDDERLAARANDAQVTLDIIHTFGARTSPFAIMSSQNIAELTGGQFASARPTPRSHASTTRRATATCSATVLRMQNWMASTVT